MSYRSHTQMVTAPPPDDSDFLESEDEQSIVDQTQNRDLTELEAELAAVTTPATSQITSASAFQRMRPTPAGKIMQMTHNFSFTYFRSPAPRAETLNRNKGREAAGLPVDPNEPTRYTTKVDAHGRQRTEPVPASSIAPHIPAHANVHWFSIDSELVYLSFFEDWGPLNVAMFYRFCLHLHHLINSAAEESTASAAHDESDLHLILYTSSEPKSKANAALLAAMYAMVCGDVSPADAYYPLNTLELLPFRDAGYGRADFYLTVQDILYGVHRAINERLLDLMTFNLEEYETYEQVQNGDWNWITPSIIAFASPNDKEYVAELRDRANGASRPTTPGLRRPLNSTFTRTVQYFKDHSVKLVVRLNNPLYDSRVFEREGIEHLDMYFDDGSNPCEEIVRNFIAKADQIISQGGAIAVHCKAGLGRTGVLIGAYLAYKHGFSAGESIGFMRIMRPGCVVGPQQHFMYQQASTWMRWREQDDAKAQLERALAAQKTELIGKRRLSDEKACSSDSGTDDATAESEVDASLGGREDFHGVRRIKKLKTNAADLPSTPRRHAGDTQTRDDTIRHAKPAPCVGQPRKSPSPSRKRAAQAQMPATIARMGSVGTLGRGRIVSADSIRSHGSASSSSSDLGAIKKDFLESAEVRSRERMDNDDGHRREQQTKSDTVVVAAAKSEEPGSRTPRARDEARCAPRAVSTDVDLSSSPRKGGHVTKHSSSGTNHRHEASRGVAAEDGLFVEGWRSPEPPSTFTERLTNSSSPQRTPNAAATTAIVAPSTPTSPSTPTIGNTQRASPHIRERFGLREAGSNQNTPRSRKEAISMMSLEGGSGSGSSSSIHSNSSLTSRDGAGSSQETTPTLQAGPLEKIVLAPSATIVSPLKASGQATQSSSQDRARTKAVRTISNSSSSSSSSSRIRNGTGATTATTTATATSRKASGSAASQQATGRVGVTGPSSTTSTGVRRHASSVANSAGRVAAARERLAGTSNGAAPSSTSSDLAQRSSIKRARAQSPDLNRENEAKVAQRAPPSGRAATGLTRPVLISAPSTAVNGSASSAAAAYVVPRFAMSTAASAAKSSTMTTQATAQQKLINVTVPPPQPQQTAGRYGSAAANYIRTANGQPGPPPVAYSRLHGRNVHRRRSSLGEADIVM